MYIDITEAIQYSSTNWRLTMFINPLQNSNLFITPTSVEQLTEIADSMSNSSEAWRMMVFTMNYCHQLVESEMRRDALERKQVRIIARPSDYVADSEAEAEEKRILTLNYLLNKDNDVYDEFGVNTKNSFNTPPKNN
jgi:hypothetical protein